MTISTNLRSTALFAASTLICAAASLAQGTGPGNDHGAAWEPMFASSGTIAPSSFVELDGGTPPVLGTTTSVQLLAPGFQFGFIAVSGSAHAGSTVNLGLDPLNVYLDPTMSLGTYALPLVGGQAHLSLPLPPMPALSGLELAFQALVLDPQNHLAASNLLAGNFGLHFGGVANFASFQFGPVNLNSNRYYPSTPHKAAIVNNTTAAAKDYTIKGTRNTGGGTLEVKDENGTVVASFGPNTPIINVTLTVAAGSKLYWYVRGSAVNQVSWTICVG